MKSAWKCMQRIIILCFLLKSGSIFSADTELMLFHPFSRGDEPAVHIVQTLKGQCEGASIRLKREHVFRCEAEGKTYDPCFIHPYSAGKTSICPLSPWNGEGVLIEMEARPLSDLNPSLDMSKALPWALELMNGEKCQALSDDAKFENLPLHYHCNQGSILFGYLQRCRSVWSMLRRQQDGQVSTAEIKVAWF